jgi:hypothetical protein
VFLSMKHERQPKKFKKIATPIMKKCIQKIIFVLIQDISDEIILKEKRVGGLLYEQGK